MPTCPAGVPQSVCSIVTNAVNSAIAADGGGVTWGSDDVLSTFKTWWDQTRGGAPVPDADPRLLDPSVTPLLQSALMYWATIAGQNSPEARALPAQTWAFPWQYASPQAFDPQTAIATALQAVAADPLAQAYLSKGSLPPFDPSKMDWGTLGTSSPMWSDVNVWPEVAAAVSAMVPSVQQFVTMASKCGFLAASSPTAIAQAWATYLASGYVDPCEQAATVVPTVGADLPALPAPAAVPAGGSAVTIVTPPASGTGTVLVIGAGLAAAGALWWAMTRAPKTHALL